MDSSFFSSAVQADGSGVLVAFLSHTINHVNLLEKFKKGIQLGVGWNHGGVNVQTGKCALTMGGHLPLFVWESI